MTVPPPEPTSSTAAVAGAVAVAQAHSAAQAALTDATLAAVLALWAQMDPLSWFDSWWRQRIGQQIYVLVSLAQESVASEARPYVEAVLNILNTPATISPLVPQTFAGIASDGTDLESLLSLAPVIAYARTQRGWDAGRASEAGANFLRQAVTTQVQDAGRAADQVAISVAVPIVPPQRQPDRSGLQPGAPGTQPASKGFRPRGRKSTYNYKAQVGYVRVLTPPSCSRCIVLAGKFYRWNEGFLRHPMCDCRHLPVTVADSDSFLADPADYFDSLEPDQQDEVFGHANAQAIRDGADISRVVNAAGSGQTWTADDGRRYTRAGTAQRRRPKNSAVGPVLRPTPNQIYRDARGNRDEAVRLLREFRYILA
jgi:hypothetical protein